MKLELILDIGDCVLDFLGTSCDTQLRLVSKDCNRVMQKWARAKLEIHNYLASAALFNFAVYELQIPVDICEKDICEKAALGGHLETLRCFYERTDERMQETNFCCFLTRLFIPRQWAGIDFRWDVKTCQSAAKGGHLHVLQWLRAQDPPCPWDQLTCGLAAKGGHLHVLRWLRTQDPPCPWGQSTCNFAAHSGHVHVLRWLRTQDPPCPWNPYTASDWEHLL
ncbi:hypothetical protein B484DRAFT_165660 [Ochromonadaceae sp. CCMP2298]|nr:hypothetical protein B484DRAFT_165660 [Ochromonadaceae sp. CCMP2298]